MSHRWLSISLGVKAQVLPHSPQGPLCSGPKLSHLTPSLLTLLALSHMDPAMLATIMVFKHSRHAPTLQALFCFLSRDSSGSRCLLGSLLHLFLLVIAQISLPLWGLYYPFYLVLQMASPTALTATIFIFFTLSAL